MKKYILIFVLLANLLPPLPALAFNSNFVVKKNEKVVLDEGEYTFSSFLVEKGGRVEINPGAHLSFVPQVEMSILGSLVVNGTAENPVLLQAFSDSWEGIISSGDAEDISLRHVLVVNANQGIRLYAPPSRVEDVRIIGGVRPTFIIGRDQPLSIKWPITLKNIQLIIPMAHVKGEGFLFEVNGSFTKGLENIFLLDLRLDTHLVYPVGITLKNSAHSTVVKGLHFPHGCTKTIDDPIPGGVFMHPISQCREGLPTLFIPGFGTSLHPKVFLRTPGGSYPQEGWSFLAATNNSYKVMQEAFRAADHPLISVFYDWRLPTKDIVEHYLKPAIERVKKQYKVDRVNIISHSYGGLVGRRYIQSADYGEDVEAFIQMGTPNHGVVKSYEVLEGGQLPADWGIFENLIRYYQLIGKNKNKREIIQKFIPSLNEVQTILWATLTKNGALVDLTHLAILNKELLSLNAKSNTLLERVQFTQYAGIGEETLSALNLGEKGTEGMWPDGVIKTRYTDRTGDATVLSKSVLLPGSDFHLIQSGHMELPEKATPEIIKQLYEKEVKIPSKPLFSSRDASSAFHFFFDCPITVKITTPSGRIIESEARENEEVFVAENREFILFELPPEEGGYTVQYTALEDTSVRWWVNNEVPLEGSLLKGESRTQLWKTDNTAPPILLESVKPPPAPEESPLPTTKATPGIVVLQNTAPGSLIVRPYELLSLKWKGVIIGLPVRIKEYLVNRESFHLLAKPQEGSTIRIIRWRMSILLLALVVIIIRV